MGTRADFYVGDGPDAEWLGSIAWDGDPEGEPSILFRAHREIVYRDAVEEILSTCDDATRPADGWPWPWDDSRMTDYAYTWQGHVLVSFFGTAWYDPFAEEAGRRPEFPNMAARRNLALPGTPRSGLIVVPEEPSA